LVRAAIWIASIPLLAPHNLRHPLMAHAHDLSNGSHRQALTVGGAYGFVPLAPKILLGLL
jgi:hypothetical protein